MRVGGLGKLSQATIALWVKTNRLPGAYNALLNTDQYDRSAIHLQVLGDGLVQFGVADAGEGKSTKRIVIGAGWQHVAVVFDGRRTTRTDIHRRSAGRDVPLSQSIPIDLAARFASARGTAAIVSTRVNLPMCGSTTRHFPMASRWRLPTVTRPRTTLRRWWNFEEIRGRRVADASGCGHVGLLSWSALVKPADTAAMIAEHAKMGIPCLRDGFVSRQPATNWERALLTGNGKIGVMVPGDPDDDAIIINRAGYFLPLNKPLPPIDQASHLAEIRNILRPGTRTLPEGRRPGRRFVAEGRFWLEALDRSFHSGVRVACLDGRLPSP